MKRKERPAEPQLTARLRRELLSIPQVTEALLQAAWPSVQFIAGDVREAPGARLRDFLATARAAHLQAAESAAITRTAAQDSDAAGLISKALFDVYGFCGEASIKQAHLFLSKLAAEAIQREQWHRAMAAGKSPKRGRAADVSLHERSLISELARCWFNEHQAPPALSENSPFIRLAELLAGECDLEVTRSKVRTALGDIKSRTPRSMPTSKASTKRR